MTNPMTDQYIKLSDAIAKLEEIAQAAADAGLPDRRDGLRDAIDAARRLPAAQVADPAQIREAALLEAAAAINARGAQEQANFGLGRETQNFYRARDLVRALIPTPASPGVTAGADVWAEAKRLVAEYPERREKAGFDWRAEIQSAMDRAALASLGGGE